MNRLTRRTVLSASAATAAFGLAGPLEIFDTAHAQQGAGPTPMKPRGLKHFKFKVGDIEVFQILDGAIERDHNPGFIRNASVEQTKAALKAAGLPEAKMPNTYTVTVVRLGGKTIMFDSGNGTTGGNPNVGMLAAHMKDAGLDPGKLDAIIVTHFHPDHIFGLMGAQNAQVYGNTEIIVPDAEYAFWSDPAVIATLPAARQGIAKRVQATMPQWKNLKRHSGAQDVVAGIKAVATPGHTPGHTSYLMGSGNAQLLVLGDVTSIPSINLRNPGWHVMFDQDAPLAERTRRATFDRAIADKLIMTGYHWGMPGAGTVAKDGSGYALTPVA